MGGLVPVLYCGRPYAVLYSHRVRCVGGLMPVLYSHCDRCMSSLVPVLYSHRVRLIGGLVPVLSVTGRQFYLDVSQQILKISRPELIAETETTTSVNFALVKDFVGWPISLLNENHFRLSTTNFVYYDFPQ